MVRCQIYNGNEKIRSNILLKQEMIPTLFSMYIARVRASCTSTLLELSNFVLPIIYAKKWEQVRIAAGQIATEGKEEDTRRFIARKTKVSLLVFTCRRGSECCSNWETAPHRRSRAKVTMLHVVTCM